MTTDTTTDTALPRIFDDDGRPARDVCHRCGYALIGLPNDNPCPECGTPPLQDIYIAFGGKKPLHPGWYAIPLIAFPLAYAFKAPNLTAMWIGTVVLLICVGASMLIEIAYNSRSAAFPAPLQFRFNHAGAIVMSAAPSTLYLRAIYGFSILLIFGSYLFVTENLDVLGVSLYGGVFIILLAIVLIRHRTARHFRIPSLDDGADRWALTCPWALAYKLTLTDLSDGLRIHAPYGRRTAMALSVRVLDIPIRATPDQRERLVAFITRAIEASGSGATISRVRKEAA